MVVDKITASSIRARKGQAAEKIAVLTAYDAAFARLFDGAGVDVLLVGDSLGMVVQGSSNTLAVTLDDIIYHTRAVARGASRALIVADLPFMSYQVSAEQALGSAGRVIKEGNAEAVKLEGGASVCEAVARMVGAGIPVMGHLGLTPQSVHALGGFRVQAKDDAARERLVADARALAQAGVFSIVLEAVPRSVAKLVTEAVSVPTIGIGAGPDCDGQVLVCYDFLGLFQGFVPRFVKRYAELGETIGAATRAYVSEVRAGQFPEEKHSFGSGPRAEPSSPDEARYASGQSASGQSASGQSASGQSASGPKARDPKARE
jgi:3-methyl-2-oxobutanoate hydroxymethyltransferase